MSTSAEAVRCRCGSPVVGWGQFGALCERCWEDAQDFMRDELEWADNDRDEELA